MPHRRRTAAETLDKRRQAVQLRLTGCSYQQIADQLGWKSHASAVAAVQAGLQAAIREPAEEVLQQELARLDQMLAGLWPKATGGDVRAVDTVLRIMDRRAKYLGLDTIKVDITQRDGDLDDLDAALAELVAREMSAGNDDT